MKNFLLTILSVFLFAGCNKAANNSNFILLSETTCMSYSEAKIKPVLSAEWQPYLASTRVCPLVKKSGDVPEVVLISVFIEDYYRDKPMDTTWEKFPKPVFFNHEGLCVARLPDGYPTEPPRDQELTYGKWQGNIPTEIKVHVLNPAVDGDYDLPVLLWDEAKRQYVAKGDSLSGKIERMGCPK